MARLGLSDRVQLFVRASSSRQGVYLRIYKKGIVEREVKYASEVPEGEFTLRTQLYGHSLGAFIEKDGHSTFLGYVSIKENFSNVIDFRSVKEAASSTFNVISNLCGKVEVSGARSYLAIGTDIVKSAD